MADMTRQGSRISVRTFVAVWGTAATTVAAVPSMLSTLDFGLAIAPRNRCCMCPMMSMLCTCHN